MLKWVVPRLLLQHVPVLVGEEGVCRGGHLREVVESCRTSSVCRRLVFVEYPPIAAVKGLEEDRISIRIELGYVEASSYCFRGAAAEVGDHFCEN